MPASVKTIEVTVDQTKLDSDTDYGPLVLFTDVFTQLDPQIECPVTKFDSSIYTDSGASIVNSDASTFNLVKEGSVTIENGLFTFANSRLRV